MSICSSRERNLWAQFDALQLGSGWDEADTVTPVASISTSYRNRFVGGFTNRAEHRADFIQRICVTDAPRDMTE